MTNIYGWNSEDELAKEIFEDGLFSDLLKGPLVFAYKNTKKTGTIYKLVISKRLDTSEFRYGFVSFSKGWKCFNPKSPKEFLLSIMLEELEENKTDKSIIQSFVENIEKYGK